MQLRGHSSTLILGKKKEFFQVNFKDFAKEIRHDSIFSKDGCAIQCEKIENFTRADLHSRIPPADHISKVELSTTDLWIIFLKKIVFEENSTDMSVVNGRFLYYPTPFKMLISVDEIRFWLVNT